MFLSVLITALIFILVLGILIFVHELGHFLVARWNGIKVEEFGFGFPPRLASIKRGETRYSLNWIPLGGFVKLLGEEEENKDPRSFSQKKPWQRLTVIVAGVVMNFVLAIVLLTIGFKIGMTPVVSDPATLGGEKTPQVFVAAINPGSPAEKAGLQPGDVLKGFSDPEELQSYTRSHAGQTVRIAIKRGDKEIVKETSLSQDEKAPLGVSVVEISKVKQPLWMALKTAAVETYKMIAFIVLLLWDALKEFFASGRATEEIKQVSGPVGIFNITGQVARLGIIYLVQFIAMLSVNLGLINILPIPALDGGRALFIALEGIFKRRVLVEKYENLLHTIGFFILIALMLFLTLRDIFKLF